MKRYRIFPPEDFMEARVTLPLSKSQSARALVIAALTPGAPAPAPVAECDDTRLIANALSDPEAVEVDCGAGGTTMRFLTAFYAVQEGRRVRLDGSERMRHRPIGVLVDALRALGADIEYEGEEGFPPLAVTGRRLEGGEIEMDATVSSQYISALLMAAPLMRQGLRIRFKGDPVSRPYIQMTLRLMADAGVEGELTPEGVSVPHGSYRAPACPRPIEGDWSAAAAWYETEAMAAGIINVSNLATEGSVQGDRRLADIYSRLGVVTEPGEEGGTDLLANPDPDARAVIDFTDNPDLVPYATVTCAMLGYPFRFTGLGTLAIKETDRITALCAEMLKVGVVIDTPVHGVMEWDGRRNPIRELPVFETYDDHRMAMALAPASIFLPGIVICDPDVVSKSYPEFWEQLAGAGFTIQEIEEEAEG